MATSRQFVVGLPEDGKVGSKTTRIHPPGGLSNISYDGMPQTEDAKNSSRILKAPGGGCSSDSIFSDGGSSTRSSTCSMASSPNESRASSTSPKTPAKKYHMKSNFELGDEQPVRPMNTPTRRPHKPSVNPVTGEVIGQSGQFFDPRNQTPPEPVKRANRIPPGGFSTPLW